MEFVNVISSAFHTSSQEEAQSVSDVWMDHLKVDYNACHAQCIA